MVLVDVDLHLDVRICLRPLTFLCHTSELSNVCQASAASEAKWLTGALSAQSRNVFNCQHPIHASCLKRDAIASSILCWCADLIFVCYTDGATAARHGIPTGIVSINLKQHGSRYARLLCS